MKIDTVIDNILVLAPGVVLVVWLNNPKKPETSSKSVSMRTGGDLSPSHFLQSLNNSLFDVLR
jgi:hypothetical protein